MTKAEERVESVTQKIWLDASETMLPLKDRYRFIRERIAYELNAARAEGVAEGAEQEREKIREASVGTKAIDITNGTIKYPTADDTAYWHMAYIIPFSVLAPDTKEGK